MRSPRRWVYHHYWQREKEINTSLFERIALEDAGVRLTATTAAGFPKSIIQKLSSTVSRNVGIPGILKYTPQRVDRRWQKPDEHGRYFYCCKTAFKPYDLAVQTLLLICKRHLGDRIVVFSGGSDFHWNAPRRLCFVYLGYRLNEFTIVREQGLVPTEQAGPNFNPNREPLL